MYIYIHTYMHAYIHTYNKNGTFYIKNESIPVRGFFVFGFWSCGSRVLGVRPGFCVSGSGVSGSGRGCLRWGLECKCKLRTRPSTDNRRL